jgi:hypothetical protein
MDYETWELPVVSNDNVSVHHFYKVIERFCDSLKLIDEKIGKAS